VWLAVYSCGAFRWSRARDGAARTGRAHQDTCCSRGGHPFKVIEYKAQMPPPAAVERRREPLRLPVLLRQLEKRVGECTRCALAETRQRTVFARGNPEASVCFVGEAPGAEEDAQGKPFVGRAGQLLDEMIGEMGLSENDVYICNIVKCRPPSNRRPEPEEIAACSSHLHEQLSLWAQASSEPNARGKRILVALGSTAINTLLETKVGVADVRGQWKLYRGRIMLMPTYHPSFLMRPFKTQQKSRHEAANDLLLVAKELGLEPRRHPARRPRLYAIQGGLDAAEEEKESTPS